MVTTEGIWATSRWNRISCGDDSLRQWMLYTFLISVWTLIIDIPSCLKNHPVVTVKQEKCGTQSSSRFLMGRVQKTNQGSHYLKHLNRKLWQRNQHSAHSFPARWVAWGDFSFLSVVGQFSWFNVWWPRRILSRASGTAQDRVRGIIWGPIPGKLDSVRFLGHSRTRVTA